MLAHLNKAGRQVLLHSQNLFWGFFWQVLWNLQLLPILTETLLPGTSTLPSKCPVEEVSLSPLASMDALLEQSREDFSGFLADEFINLSPPQAQDYHFGLEEGEGISELFDCDFGDFTPLDF